MPKRRPVLVTRDQPGGINPDTLVAHNEGRTMDGQGQGQRAAR